MKESLSVFDDEKVKEAIDSLGLVKCQPRTFCKHCMAYITDEDFWRYRWKSDYGSYRELHAEHWPTKEKVASYIEKKRWKA